MRLTITYALCMTEATLQSQSAFAIVLRANFTMAFWAKARDSLNFEQNATFSAGQYIIPPRGCLLNPAHGTDNDSVGIGFYLGTDGFALVAYGADRFVPIIGYREPLFGWHHYALISENNESFVYVDGQRNDSLTIRAVDHTQLPWIQFFLRGTRNQKPSTGFEGWLSELRFANRSMHFGEALAQINNQSAWDFGYSTEGCSGENHTGTDFERFKLQQAWLVCKEPQVTLGMSTTISIVTTFTNQRQPSFENTTTLLSKNGNMLQTTSGTIASESSIIIGSIVGGMIFVVILLIIFYVIWKRSKSGESNKNVNPMQESIPNQSQYGKVEFKGEAAYGETSFASRI